MEKTNAKLVLQNLGRDINLLTDQDRFNRKKAIDVIYKQTLDNTGEIDLEVLDVVLSDITKFVLKLFYDTVENLREKAILFVEKVLARAIHPEEYLHIIVPVLVQRIGQQELIEQSEEIRLHLIKLLHQIMILSSSNLEVYVDDIIKILQRTLLDKYHEVKKESCICCSLLASSSTQKFYNAAENLIGSLIQCLAHQHSKVRIQAIYTIGTVMLHSCNKQLDKIIPNFAQKFFDPVGIVRLAVTEVVGDWLLNLLDRYSYHYKLIPLLLTSLEDELPNIRETAENLWYDVGMKYASENDEELKDALNFEKEHLDHYPENITRPNLGCRRLVYLHFSKIAPGIAGDLTDWKLETRVKASELLYVLLINEETNVTQHIDKILPSLFKTIIDEDEKIRTNSEKCVTLIGCFGKADVWLKLVMNQIQFTSGGRSSLLILGSLCKGCSRQVLHTLLQQIFNKLCLPEICQTTDEKTQLALLSVISSVISVCKSDIGESDYDVFLIIITVAALSQSTRVKSDSFRFLSELSSVIGIGDKQKLIDMHARRLLDSIKESSSNWAKNSAERFIVDLLLVECNAIVLDKVSDILLPILHNALEENKDIEIRAKFLTLIGRLMMAAESGKGISNSADELLTKSILKCIVWKAGRTAAALRTAAASCVWAMVNGQHLKSVKEIVVPLTGLIEDDIKETRLISLETLEKIFLSSQYIDLDEKTIHDAYHPILKRLDDISDDVRVLSAKTLEAYFNYFEKRPNGYEPQLYSAHLDDIYQTLLIHLDDQNNVVQEAVGNTLKFAGKMNIDRLLAMIAEVRFKHRSMKYLDEITNFLRNLDLKE